jgi:hypothetical protein
MERDTGSHDPVVEAYMRDIDRTLIRENLRLTPDQRLRKLIRFLSFLDEVRDARRRIPRA